ncbi:hypothetical protein BGX34_010435 [Mortierella sp. NVP85]|nr:hypothetical protein BGX34_010435 [Mortierella sp. NVP85]
MSSSHPLDLPEILSTVALHLPDRWSLLACACVSKSWHQVFNAHVWRSIQIDKERPDLPKAIHSYSHLVRNLILDRTPAEEHVALRCPNLASLYVRCVPKAPDVTEFVTDHRFLIRLRLEGYSFSPLPTFWAKLLQLRHLKDLMLSDMALGIDHVDTFWDLCAQLERLEIRKFRISSEGDLKSRTFPYLTELSMWHFTQRDVPLILGFARRCPMLKLIDWVIDSEIDAEVDTEDYYDVDVEFVSGFAQLITEGTWPELDSVHVGCADITNEDLCKIIGGMKQIRTLEIRYSPESFQSNSMDLLRPHFSNIRILELQPNDNSVATIAQEVMSSCPLLEQLMVPRIDAALIAEGKPWVCLKLESLNIGLKFDPSTLSRIQPLVLNQLSRLTRLQEIFIWGNKDEENPGATVDLRLERGLDKLATLKSLRIVCLSDGTQKMNDQEIDWMVEHWTSLICMFGVLNEDPKKDADLKARLSLHGVSA